MSPTRGFSRTMRTTALALTFCSSLAASPLRTCSGSLGKACEAASESEYPALPDSTSVDHTSHMSELVRHLEAEKSARAFFKELLVKTDIGARLSGLEYENQILRQQLLDKSDSDSGTGHSHWVLGAAVLCAAGLCAAGLCALCITHSGSIRSGVVSKLLASTSSLKGEASLPPQLLTVLEDCRDAGQLTVQEQESASTNAEIRAPPEQKELEALEQKLSRALESQIHNLHEELRQSARSEAKSLQERLDRELENLRMEVARVELQEPQLERKTNESEAELCRMNSEIVGLREELESLKQNLSSAVESQVQKFREELERSAKSEAQSLQQGLGSELEGLRTQVARLASQEQLEGKINKIEAQLCRMNSEVAGVREELGQKSARPEAEALKADFGNKFASLREEVVSANSEVKTIREEQGSEIQSLRDAVERLKVQELESLGQKLSSAMESRIQYLREEQELGQKLARSEADALKADFGNQFTSLHEEVVSANSEVKTIREEHGSEVKSLRDAVESLKVQESETQTEITRLRSFVVNNFPVERLRTFWPTSKTVDVSSLDFSNYTKEQRWESEHFSLGGIGGLYLWLYPKGEKHSSDGHCGLFLLSETEGVTLSMTLTMDGTTRQLLPQLFIKGASAWGFPDFAPAKQSYSTLKIELLKASYK